MSHGSDLGSYWLDASIAKSSAEALARTRARKAQMSHNEQIADMQETIVRLWRESGENYDAYAHAALISAARRASRDRSNAAAQVLSKRAANEVLTSEDIRLAFLHETDKATRLKNMIADSRETARIWIEGESNAANIASIRKALGKIEAECNEALSPRKLWPNQRAQAAVRRLEATDGYDAFQIRSGCLSICVFEGAVGG